MTREMIICRYCLGAVGPHWQVFDHITCHPAPKPAPLPGPQEPEARQQRLQEAERQVNRQVRVLDTVLATQWRMPYFHWRQKPRKQRNR